MEPQANSCPVRGLYSGTLRKQKKVHRLVAGRKMRNGGIGRQVGRTKVCSESPMLKGLSDVWAKRSAGAAQNNDDAARNVTYGGARAMCRIAGPHVAPGWTGDVMTHETRSRDPNGLPADP
jgi:hypothetical protein